MCKCSYLSPEGVSCQFVGDGFIEGLISNVTEKFKRDENSKILLDSLEYKFELNGKPYCIFHYPIIKKKEWNINQRFIFFIVYQTAFASRNDFSGTHFISAKQLQNDTDLKYQIDGDSSSNCMYFRNCYFDDGIYLDNNGKAIMSVFDGSDFLGVTNINGHNYTGISFEACKFRGVLRIAGNGNLSNLSFNKSVLEKGADFRGRGFVGFCTFVKTIFLGPARFEDCKFSQGTDFTDTVFKEAAIKLAYESSFRVIRKAMGENKNHPFEGKFYALEQRCNRQKYPLYSSLKWFSCLYDWTSVYGTNPGRAGLALLLMQAPFFWVYSKMLACSQIRSFSFTLAQIFKPFEMFSYKSMSYEPIKTLVVHNPYLPHVTAIHSVLTFSLFAIFLLALRWRFRKG